jgi:hypothetical protein
MTYPLPEILDAFTLYDRGNTLEETAERISSRHGHRVGELLTRWARASYAAIFSISATRVTGAALIFSEMRVSELV